MRPLLFLAALLLPASLLHAQSNVPGKARGAQPTPSTRIGTPPAEKATLSKEQQAKQDALIKANPELKEFVERVEARGGKINSWGNTDEAGMAAAGAKAKGKSTTGGNKKAAEAAYKRKDYQGALQHYKALAADGDTEAAVMLGIMHEQGQGVDKDPSAAYAWYGRAAEQGDPVAREIVRDINDKDQMKEGDLDAAGKKYEEIAQELDGPGTTAGAGEQFENIRDETNINTELYERRSVSGREPDEQD